MKAGAAGLALAFALPCVAVGDVAAAVVEACSPEVAVAAVRKAEEAVEHFKSYRRDVAFTARLAQAEAALIAPDVATLGPAVFLVRDGVAGEWSYPVFYQVLNPQLGGAAVDTDVAFLFLTREGIGRMVDGGLELTRDGEISFIAVGPGIEGTPGIEINPDIAVFASDPRAEVAGSRLLPMPACTEAYYGSPFSPSDIVPSDLPHRSAADHLREALLVLPPPRVLPR